MGRKGVVSIDIRTRAHTLSALPFKNGMDNSWENFWGLAAACSIEARNLKKFENSRTIGETNNLTVSEQFSERFLITDSQH